jgi:hypothetical protein
LFVFWFVTVVRWFISGFFRHFFERAHRQLSMQAHMRHQSSSSHIQHENSALRDPEGDVP